MNPLKRRTLRSNLPYINQQQKRLSLRTALIINMVLGFPWLAPKEQRYPKSSRLQISGHQVPYVLKG